nr:immunoglobulin heavy chain junction region [Macaca mulatta]
CAASTAATGAFEFW